MGGARVLNLVGQFYVKLNDILINNIVCQLSQFGNF